MFEPLLSAALRRELELFVAGWGEHVEAAHRAQLVLQHRLSNPEIGARLFLSPRTVEWHLRHVFTKLAIRSRRELANALPSAGPGLART
ncbi:MAG TPA: helix-turn-helix transcriptional regulator [Solirubrobacteraceae bacterium]|nr:helix-turn-helix transcriptional regulator [Solirubrobacteraceae bacterium]